MRAWLDAAHQLDHDVAADDQALDIRREQLPRQLHITRGVEVAHGDAGELELSAGALSERVALLQEQAGHLGAHGSGTQQRNAESALFVHSSPSPAASGSAASVV